MKTSYKIGDRFKICGEEAILARPSANMCQFICLKDGNRWRDPIPVSDTYDITDKEIKEMLGDAGSKSVEGLTRPYPPEQTPFQLLEQLEKDVAALKATYIKRIQEATEANVAVLSEA